jgi:tetratricopeptide (TPR) repeat protein
MRHFGLLLIIALLFWVVPKGFAQDASSEAPQATPQVSGASISNPQAEQVLAEAQQVLTEARAATDLAFNLLGLFELIALALAILAVIGFGSYGVILSRLASARSRIIKDFQKATLALSILPLGEQQYLVQDFQGAAATYKHALSLDKDNPVIHYRLGYAYVLMDELGLAEQHLERALEIDQEFMSAQAALGYVYRRKAEKLPAGKEQNRRFDEALQKLLTALEAFPNLVDLDRQSWWGAVGSLHRRRGDYQDALEAYQQAAKVTPHSSYPWGHIARIHLYKGEFQQAFQNFERVEKLSFAKTRSEPDNYWWYADLLTARLALGKNGDIGDIVTSTLSTLPVESRYARDSLAHTLRRVADNLREKYSDRAENIDTVLKRLEQV